MRIKAGNSLSQDAQTLDFGSGFSLTEANGDVTIGLGGTSSLAPRTLIQPIVGSGTTFITRFQSGHGWTLVNNAGTIADDTTTLGLFANQSVKAIAATAGSAPYTQKSGLALNLTTNPLVIWVKWDQVTPELDFNYPKLTVFAGDAGFANIYTWTHYLGSAAGGTGNPVVNADGWTAYELFLADAVVTGAPTPAAIDTIRISFANNSGTNYIGGIGTRTLPTTQYPNGVITLAFDDSIKEQYFNGLPVLDKYGYAGVACTITDVVGTPGYLTLAQMHQMQDYHGWEIAGHAFTKVNHDLRYTTLDTATVTTELLGLKKWLLDNGFVSDAWVSPGGKVNDTIWEIARNYFTVHRGVGGPGGALGRIAYLQSPKPVYPAQLWSGAFDTTSYTLATMQAMITAVATNKSWGVLCFHSVTTAASSGLSISVTDLDTLCSNIQAAGCAVRTFKQVLALA